MQSNLYGMSNPKGFQFVDEPGVLLFGIHASLHCSKRQFEGELPCCVSNAAVNSFRCYCLFSVWYCGTASRRDTRCRTYSRWK
jgi:hypothetical protein